MVREGDRLCGRDSGWRAGGSGRFRTLKVLEEIPPLASQGASTRKLESLESESLEQRLPMIILRAAVAPILLQDGVDEALQTLELALVRILEVQGDAVGVRAYDFR